MGGGSLGHSWSVEAVLIALVHGKPFAFLIKKKDDSGRFDGSLLATGAPREAVFL